MCVFSIKARSQDHGRDIQAFTFSVLARKTDSKCYPATGRDLRSCSCSLVTGEHSRRVQVSGHLALRMVNRQRNGCSKHSGENQGWKCRRPGQGAANDAATIAFHDFRARVRSSPFFSAPSFSVLLSVLFGSRLRGKSGSVCFSFSPTLFTGGISKFSLSLRLQVKRAQTLVHMLDTLGRVSRQTSRHNQAFTFTARKHFLPRVEVLGTDFETGPTRLEKDMAHMLDASALGSRDMFIPLTRCTHVSLLGTCFQDGSNESEWAVADWSEARQGLLS